MAYQLSNMTSELKTLVAAQWTSNNTDSITPTFDYVYNRKLYTHNESTDFVFFQDMGRTPIRKHLGNLVRERTYRIRIDIRSNYTHPRETVSGYDHLYKLKKELNRILDTYTSYAFTNGIGEIKSAPDTDLSDGMKNLWRAIFEVEIIMYNETVS